MARKKQKLPFIVGCLAFFMLIGSLIVLTMACIAAFHFGGRDIVQLPEAAWKAVADIREMTRPTPWLWIIPLVHAIVALPTSIGLFAKKRWAYNAYTVMNGFAVGSQVVEVFWGHYYWMITPLIINILILIYMLLPGVRKVFN